MCCINLSAKQLMLQITTTTINKQLIKLCSKTVITKSLFFFSIENKMGLLSFFQSLSWNLDFFNCPIISVGSVILGISIIIGTTVVLFKRSNSSNTASNNDSSEVNKASIIFDNILSRRTITPKDCLPDSYIEKKEWEMILEAANWAPTHQKTEPWRYIIMEGSDAIISYLDFIEKFYESIENTIPEDEINRFRKKFSGIRDQWPYKCCAVVVIAMNRQLPNEEGRRMPEWEEICAVAMSVQNIHLMITSMGDIAGYWSSHTWCKRVRDSKEMRKYLNLSGDEDRVFGAFVIGRYDKSAKKFRSIRRPIWDKVEFRND